MYYHGSLLHPKIGEPRPCMLQCHPGCLEVPASTMLPVINVIRADSVWTRAISFASDTYAMFIKSLIIRRIYGLSTIARWASTPLSFSVPRACSWHSSADVFQQVLTIVSFVCTFRFFVGQVCDAKMILDTFYFHLFQSSPLQDCRLQPGGPASRIRKAGYESRFRRDSTL